MSLWTEEQAKEYFLSGGKDEPSTSVTDVSDSSQAQSADLEAKVQALKGHGNEKLKGKDWIDKQGQMEMIAEKEMKKAADSIERAAQRLAELKLKRNVLDENEEVVL